MTWHNLFNSNRLGRSPWETALSNAERFEVETRLALQQDISHDLAGKRRKEDSVAVVAAGQHDIGAIFVLPNIGHMVVKEKLAKSNNLLGIGEQFHDKLKDGSLGPEMVVIPPGAFKMGDSQSSQHPEMSSAQPVHEVTFLRPFAMGIYEITYEEYDHFTQSTKRQLLNDQGWGRGKHPAVKVPWEEAVEYAEWLTTQTGERYRLPSEAEWEYAARAGTTTNFWWGDAASNDYANYGKGVGGWFPSGVVSGKDQWMYTAPVGSFTANSFGLYDMHGNAWEHVQDCWHDNYTGAPSDGSAWLDSLCPLHVMRSGSWGYEEVFLRSAKRVKAFWGVKAFLFYGFRLIREIPDYG